MQNRAFNEYKAIEEKVKTRRNNKSVARRCQPLQPMFMAEIVETDTFMRATKPENSSPKLRPRQILEQISNDFLFIPSVPHNYFSFPLTACFCFHCER